jgi:hypothetical protein
LAALENDDDLLLLSSLKEEKVLAYQKLDIDNSTNDQCRTMFRFGREDINILSNALVTIRNSFSIIAQMFI